MDNNSELNNQIISQEDKKIIERLSKERGLKFSEIISYD